MGLEDDEGEGGLEDDVSIFELLNKKQEQVLGLEMHMYPVLVYIVSMHNSICLFDFDGYV